MTPREPMDLEAYAARARGGPCFDCAFLSGEEGYAHETVCEDDAHIAFLDKYPTLLGRVLVAPKAHVEHVVSDLDEAAYLRLIGVVRRVTLAVEAVLSPERTYLLSLGSRRGNAHVHWHIAPLPPGVPYERQQYYALMAENGVLAPSAEEAARLAPSLREALSAG
jgi:histidine triad (HIT) family protein